MIFRIASVLAGLMMMSGEALAETSAGAYLAAAGNCIVCHSAPDGKPFAGGLAMRLPFGTIFSTNITPDRETGIGDYTPEDFIRAMRFGIARDGHRLYPAMPYPSYAKMTDGDLQAMFAYFTKEVAPVRQVNQRPQIAWPLSMRWPLAIWNVTVDRTPFVASADHSGEWNRGAYLVQGPAHCGACHTPRNFLFQEKAQDDTGAAFLSGALLDDWSAPNLRGSSRTGLGAWNENDIAAYLRTGHGRFGTAFGTMREVVAYSTSQLSQGDLKAMAVYLKSLPASPESDVRRAVASSPELYNRHCASCHGSDGEGAGREGLALDGMSVVADPDPTSLVRLVLNGAGTADQREDAPAMPQFRTWLDDSSIAAVVTYIRNAWSNRASAVATDRVTELRKTTDPASDRVGIYRMR